MKPEDLGRLSPLADKHFNVLGRYHFTVTDSILRGDLRPLRDPAQNPAGAIRWQPFGVIDDRKARSLSDPFTGSANERPDRWSEPNLTRGTARDLNNTSLLRP